jgi:hypothetical protein
MGQHGGDFKVGDRVQTASGITGTVVEPPRYYESAKGDSFTGRGVTVEADTAPVLSLTRTDRGLSPGARHLVRLDLVSLIDE